jgi:hypothetical protein
MRVKQHILKLGISICSIMPGILPINMVGAVVNNFLDTPVASAQAEVVVDNRAQNIDNYFAKNNLPLAGYGEVFVEVADRYDLDYRLLPAIAMRESTGGKNPCPNDEHNVFGWHSCKTTFDSYEQAIDKVGAHLAGEIKSTKGYYANKTVWKKLRTYNSVISPYPDQVIAIMNKIEKAPVDESAPKVDGKDIAMK